VESVGDVKYAENFGETN